MSMLIAFRDMSILGTLEDGSDGDVTMSTLQISDTDDISNSVTWTWKVGDEYCGEVVVLTAHYMVMPIRGAW